MSQTRCKLVWRWLRRCDDVVTYGALLNLFTARWSDTDCLLEKRRNDFVALALWLGLAVLTIVVWI